MQGFADMEAIALIVGVVLAVLAVLWVISIPFRRLAQERIFERMLKDPEIQDLLYLAVARSSLRRKKNNLIAMKTGSTANAPRPKGRMAGLLWEAELEAARLKKVVLEDIYSEED